MHACSASLNYRFSLIAIGTRTYVSLGIVSLDAHLPRIFRGSIHLYPIPLSHTPPTTSIQVLSLFSLTGPVQAMEWTSDGYALAVGYEKGWAIWSVGGRCLGSAVGIEDMNIGPTSGTRREATITKRWVNHLPAVTLGLMTPSCSVSRASYVV